jgi:hypothetical protein
MNLHTLLKRLVSIYVMEEQYVEVEKEEKMKNKKNKKKNKKNHETMTRQQAC